MVLTTKQASYIIVLAIVISVLPISPTTIRDCFCHLNSHFSDDLSVLYRDSPGWWDPLSEIPAWLHEKGIIMWPNVEVCGKEYAWEDWQITEAEQCTIISILTYGTYN